MKNPVERLSEKLLKGDSQKAALVISGINRRYLTEFESSAGALFVTTKGAWLLLDFRYAEAATYKAKNAEVVLFKSMLDSVKALIEDNGIKEIYLEAATLPYAQAMSFKKLFESAGAEAVLDNSLDDAIKALRIIKSPYEVKKIEAAQEITDAAYSYILNKVKPGVTERDMAVELEFFMKKQGAEDLAFSTIFVAGKNGSQCHGVPSDNIVNKGDFVTIDMGAKLDGYHSDMTRTFAVGFVTDEQRDVYNTVLKAHLAAAAAVKPGVKCNAIDKIARDIIETPYPDTFGHGLGHGVGFEIHEWPAFNFRDETIIEPGMVITDEPGIYIAGKFGVRIEDMLLVTEDGCRSLTKSDKELLIL